MQVELYNINIGRKYKDILTSHTARRRTSEMKNDV